MTATGKSILKHPVREEINERLLAGESVEAVQNWLRQRFSRDKKMWVNKMTLQAYRRNFLNLDGDVLADLKKERSAKLTEERKRRAVEVAQSSENYQLAKARYAEGYALQIENTNEMLQDIYSRVESRIAFMEAEDTKHLNDKVIVEQCRLMKDILKDHFEMQQQLKVDQSTNINIDIAKVMTEQKLLKATLRETISEVCPEVWPIFIEIFTTKMEQARLQVNEKMNEDDDPLGTNINIQV